MRVLISLMAAIVVSLCATGANALGLGKITVQSYLNENFRATLPILGTNADDVDRLAVFLADPQQFKKAGLERPFVLAMLKFKIVSDKDGPKMIKISSDRPIKEPILNFIIELAAPESRVFQEYSVLLDPNPASVGRQGAAQRSDTTVTSAGSATTQDIPASASTQVPFEPKIDRASPGSATQYGPVAQRETLWSIASKIRPDEEISVQQMMLALFRENPDAFADGRIGGLRQGATLHIPPREVISNIPTDTAFAAIQSANNGE